MTEHEDKSGGSDDDIFELLASLFGGDSEELKRSLSQSGTDLEGLEALGGQLPPGFTQMFSQFATGSIFPTSSESDTSVNWELAHNLARQSAVADGDPSVGPRAERESQDALHAAELWLDASTALPASGATTHVWSRSEWVEATLPQWRNLTESIADSMAEAMSEVMRESGAQMPEGAMPFGVDPSQMLRHFGGTVFGMQVGSAVGTLAGEVLGAGDIGVCLTSDPVAALLPVNISALAESFDEPEAELRLFIALREAALSRLYTHASWLRSRLDTIIERYAQEIRIDMEQLEETVRSIDPANPEELQDALSGGVFEVSKTPEQQRLLTQLETLLALIDGWVDVVVAHAAGKNLPRSAALREIMTRRRAVGGPAEQTFMGLVGLELRPRRLREASELWQVITDEWGADKRDELWSHPDFLPEDTDLDDAQNFLTRHAKSASEHQDLDQVLSEILNEHDEDSGNE